MDSASRAMAKTNTNMLKSFFIGFSSLDQRTKNNLQSPNLLQRTLSAISVPVLRKQEDDRKIGRIAWHALHPPRHNRRRIRNSVAISTHINPCYLICLK